MTHTPGPWRVDVYQDKSWLIIGPGPYVDPEDGTAWDQTFIGEVYRNEDDAHLVAAVPDLLEALEGLFKTVYVIEPGFLPDRYNDELDVVLERARVAIVKARGQNGQGT